MKRILLLILSMIFLCIALPAASADTVLLTHIKQDDMIIGRCVAPASYTIKSQAYCCTEKQCLDHPWLLYVGAYSPDGIVMEYLSGTWGNNGFGDRAVPDPCPALHDCG